MSQSIGAYLLERLGSWGVDRIFAYPGDGINGILAAWEKADSAAAVRPGRGMRRWRRSKRWAMPSSRARSGCAWPRRDRGPSTSSTACMTPSLITFRCWPSSDRPTALRHGRLLSARSRPGSACSRTSASQYVQTLNAPQQLPNLIDRAIRTALATHSPTCIIVPYDVQELD